jgi:hypothetical protein
VLTYILLLLVTLSKSYSFPKLLFLSRVSILPNSFLLLDSSFLALQIFFFFFVLELVALDTLTVFFVFLDNSLSSKQAVETCPLRLQLKQRLSQRN